jgi:hypothetical protein
MDLGMVAGEEVKVIYGDPASELQHFSGQERDRLRGPPSRPGRRSRLGC